MTLRVMKAERIAKLLDDPVWDEALMIQLPREILECIIRDILEAGVDKDAFDRWILHITQPEIQSSAMTIAQQLRQEGLWIGRIPVLEEFLNLPVSSREVLDARTVDELEAAHPRLHAEYEMRFKRS